MCLLRYSRTVVLRSEQGTGCCVVDRQLVASQYQPQLWRWRCQCVASVQRCTCRCCSLNLNVEMRQQSAGTELPLMVEIYGLLNYVFPFLSILDACYAFLTFIWQMSCLTLSSHRYLGLPSDLLIRGFHLNIFLTVLVSGFLCTWPNQLSLWALI